MASFSSAAFSTSALSVAAFDFDSTPPSPSPSPSAVPTRPDKEGYSYLPLLRIEEKRQELERIDDEIAEAEKRRLAAIKRSKAKLLAEKAAKKLAALEASLQEEINALRIERARLMRLIDDDEAILVLLLSRPFH